MQLKKIVGVAVVSALFAASVQARDFRSADVHPNDYPTVMGVKKMGDVISARTGGKYNIKVFGNSTLGSEKDTVEQVKIGALDMVRVSSSTFHPIIAETSVLSFPFIYRDINHYRKVINGPIGEEVLKKFEKAGFIGLAFWESGARSVYAKKPIRTLADAKGVKIRVQPSDLSIELAKAMGMSPTPIPYAEVYTALKTGLVDAAENNIPSYETAKHFEVATVFSETEHMMTPEVIVFSKKIWDTMTPEEQKNIKDAAKEATPYYIEQWVAKEKASRDATTAAGSTFISDVKKPEFVEAMKPVWDKFATTPELKDLVQQIVNTK